MAKSKIFLGVVCAIAIGLAACGGEQSDWEKARASNKSDSYESFVKKYPNGAFAPQAKARLKELSEERDWQLARDADSPESYQSFLKQYPEGKWTEEARIRVENFNLAQAPAGAPGASPPAASSATAPAPGAPSATLPPLVTHKPAPAAAPSVETKAPVAAAGSYGVQLGAFSGGAKAADRHWAKLTKKYPAGLQGLTPIVHKTKSSKGNVYRLQVTGLSRANAMAICKQLKAKGDSCAVISPAHSRHKTTAHARKTQT